MAESRDLSKLANQRETKRLQGTRNRDYTLPAYRNTKAPELEVNARPVRQNDSGAQQLRQILGLVTDTAAAFADVSREKQLERDKEIGAEAALDAANGIVDEDRFERNRAYRRSHEKASAESLAYAVERDVAPEIEDLFNDPQNPPSLTEVEALLNQRFGERTIDENGKPRFQAPEANALLARAFGSMRGKFLGEAAKAIDKTSTDNYLNTVGVNFIHDLQAETPGSLSIEVGEEADGYVPPEGSMAAANARSRAEGDGQGEVVNVRDAGKPVATTAPAPRNAPTGRLPISGTITERFASHSAKRGPGMDIDGKIGDPVEAPADGTVIKVQDDGKSGSGLHVIVDHGGGITSSYSHLSRSDVKVGDTVTSGQKFAAVGNSGNVRSSGGGDGSHLHYRVKVNKKDVNPEGFNFAGATGGSGGTQTAATGPRDFGDQPEAGQAKGDPTPLFSSVPFESLLDQVRAERPDINIGYAKSMLLNAVTIAAVERGDWKGLQGLALSSREDGTPSFSIAEVGKLQEAADAVRGKVRNEAKRVQADRHEQTANNVIEHLLDGGQVSPATLQQMVDNDEIDPRLAYSLNNARIADEKQEEREAKAERAAQKAIEREAAREAAHAEREAQRDKAMLWGAEAELRRTGALDGASYEDDLRRLRRGEFGSGTAGLAIFKQMRASTRAGGEAAKDNPEYARWGGTLKSNFEPKADGSGSLLTRSRGGGGADPNSYSYPAMVSEFNRLIKEGTPPHRAYSDAVAKYGPKEQTKTQRQILEERRAQLRGR